LIDTDYIIVARQNYLKLIVSNRILNSFNTIPPEVYLDESIVYNNLSQDFVWYFRCDGPCIQKPTVQSERLIIMNAITKDGWVPQVKVVFKSTRKTGDYHGQMNRLLFKKC